MGPAKTDKLSRVNTRVIVIVVILPLFIHQTEKRNDISNNHDIITFIEIKEEEEEKEKNLYSPPPHYHHPHPHSWKHTAFSKGNPGSTGPIDGPSLATP